MAGFWPCVTCTSYVVQEAGKLLRGPSTCATACRELLLHVLSGLVLWSGTNGSGTYITGTHEISNSLDIATYIVEYYMAIIVVVVMWH